MDKITFCNNWNTGNHLFRLQYELNEIHVHVKVHV